MDFEPISKLLSAAIGCKARGTALSAKRVLDVPQYASEPFPPSALPTNFSLDLASKLVLKWVLIKEYALHSTNAKPSVLYDVPVSLGKWEISD